VRIGIDDRLGRLFAHQPVGVAVMVPKDEES
jgi:hypothetical protein